ncbi:MAG: Cas9 inhibitor AcrIIA9 family protein [Candidatus Fimenecus sp.]
MYKEKAIEKLDRELKAFRGTDIKATAVKDAVADTLKMFCEQDEEFAQAVVQTDKTLTDCCESIMKKVGQSISDIDTYKQAVNFYFAGAVINFKMTIDLTGSAAEKQGKVIELTFDDLF